MSTATGSSRAASAFSRSFSRSGSGGPNPAVDARAWLHRARRRVRAGPARRHHSALFPADAGLDRPRRLAQIFFCLTVAIALFTSRGWTGAGIRARSTTACCAWSRRRRPPVIYLQILVGATMRHSDAGLAIPDFPLVFGGLCRPQWTPQIAIHYAHRVGALIVTLAIAATVGPRLVPPPAARRSCAGRPDSRRASCSCR